MDLSKFDPEAVKLFLEEATDMQDQIEESLLTLEADPTNQDAVNNAFRGFHTIKGGAGMIGLKSCRNIPMKWSSCYLTFEVVTAMSQKNSLLCFSTRLIACEGIVQNWKAWINLTIESLKQV